MEWLRAKVDGWFGRVRPPSCVEEPCLDDSTVAEACETEDETADEDAEDTGTTFKYTELETFCLLITLLENFRIVEIVKKTVPKNSIFYDDVIRCFESRTNVKVDDRKKFRRWISNVITNSYPNSKDPLYMLQNRRVTANWKTFKAHINDIRNGKSTCVNSLIQPIGTLDWECNCREDVRTKLSREIDGYVFPNLPLEDSVEFSPDINFIDVSGGAQTHHISNKGRCTIAYVIRLNEGSMYSTNVMYGYLEAGEVQKIILTRSPGAPRRDFCNIEYCLASKQENPINSVDNSEKKCTIVIELVHALKGASVDYAVVSSLVATTVLVALAAYKKSQ